MAAQGNTMSRSQYIPWTSEEEENLPTWVSHHEHLSWEEIREEYVRQLGIPRTVHSLRGKLDQLEKGHRRQRPISRRASELHHMAARRARRQQQKPLAMFPPSPPPLNLKRPNPRARQLLQQMQQLEITRSGIPIESLPIEDNSQALPSQAWSIPSEPETCQTQTWH